MTTNIYVLKLESGFYYVGKSENVQKRFEQHLAGIGSAFTKRYKPLCIDQVFENVSPFYEDAIVKKYMAKYGINKVRGGSYSLEVLDESQIHFLRKEIWSAKDLCTRCGSSSHWIQDCYATKTVNGSDIDEFESEDEFVIVENEPQKEFNWLNLLSKGIDNLYQIFNDRCFRCGRLGHWEDTCYATFDVNGKLIN